MDDNTKRFSGAKTLGATYSEKKTRRTERLLPKTLIRKAHLKAYGIPFTLKRFLEFIEAGIVTPSDATQRGNPQFGFNLVELYDLEKIARDVAERPERYSQTLETPKEPERPVYGYFRVYKTNSHGERFYLGDEEFEGIKKGSWIYLASGERKNPNSPNITWFYEDME
jgi:hypothetical protein